MCEANGIECDRSSRRLAIPFCCTPEVRDGILVLVGLNGGFTHLIKRTRSQFRRRILIEHALHQTQRLLTLAGFEEVIRKGDLSLESKRVRRIASAKEGQQLDRFIAAPELQRDLRLIVHRRSRQHVIRMSDSKALERRSRRLQQSVRPHLQGIGELFFGGIRKRLRVRGCRTRHEHPAQHRNQGKYVGKTLDSRLERHDAREKRESRSITLYAHQSDAPDAQNIAANTNELTYGYQTKSRRTACESRDPGSGGIGQTYGR